jgi:hypothetical protein
MTKKPVCKCTMNVNDDFSSTMGKMFNHSNSCCKTEVKFISNSSEYESYQKVSIRNISNALITIKLFQISNPVYSGIKSKDILLFYYIPDDIPVKNSTFLI